MGSGRSAVASGHGGSRWRHDANRGRGQYAERTARSPDQEEPGLSDGEAYHEDRDQCGTARTIAEEAVSQHAQGPGSHRYASGPGQPHRPGIGIGRDACGLARNDRSTRCGPFMGVSRPVGRVLCPRGCEAAVIHLGLPLPAVSCGLPASIGRAALERSRRSVSSGTGPLDLAPGGVYQAASVTCGAGGLLHHRFTLTPSFGERRGGLFSVALSRGSPRVGVTDHPALWSPDLPHRAVRPGATARPAHPHTGYCRRPARRPHRWTRQPRLRHPPGRSLPTRPTVVVPLRPARKPAATDRLR